MPRLERSELASGLVIILIGALFTYGATDYRMGTITRMGPGFVPFGVGIIMICLGVLVIVSAFGRDGTLPRLDHKGLFFVSLAIVAFAVMLPRVGLVPAAIVTVAISSLAGGVLRWPTVAILCACVAFGAWVVFVLLLGISIPVLRSPF